MTQDQTNQTQKLPTLALRALLPAVDYVKHWSPERGCSDIKEAIKALPLYEKSLLTMPEQQIKPLLLKYFLPFKSPAHLDRLEAENLGLIHIQNFLEFPADLVEPAMRHVALHFTWGTPKPGDYRAVIEEEWSLRKTRRNGLKHYISWYEKRIKPKLEEDARLEADLAIERRERDAKKEQKAA